jgi:ABC-type uncharacterized transport system substrate-binding protein
VAAHGARATRRARAAHRCADECGRRRSRRTGPACGVCAGTAAIGLDRRPQRTHRLSLGAGDVDRIRKYATELVALAPDVILATGTTVMGPLQQVNRTVSIVFVQIIDPVGLGYVASLARPGGNATGFMLYELGMSGKWLELLKEIAPRVTRVAVLRDTAISVGIGQLGAIQSVASSFGVELSPLGVSDAGEIERAVAAFARSPNGGLIVTGSTLAIVHRELIATLAARHRLPAVYPFRFFVTVGGAYFLWAQLTHTAARPAMSIASSRARSRPTSRCSRP